MPYKNKEDQLAYGREHYKRNKEKYKERSKKRNKEQRQKNKEYIKHIKQNSCCVDCGEDNPIVLEFDHVRGVKKANISDMARQSYSIKTIQKEIDKCEIRCANCHREATHKRRNSCNLQKQ